jgi:hypothetical protein
MNLDIGFANNLLLSGKILKYKKGWNMLLRQTKQCVYNCILLYNMILDRRTERTKNWEKSKRICKHLYFEKEL